MTVTIYSPFLLAMSECSEGMTPKTLKEKFQEIEREMTGRERQEERE